LPEVPIAACDKGRIEGAYPLNDVPMDEACVNRQAIRPLEDALQLVRGRGEQRFAADTFYAHPNPTRAHDVGAWRIFRGRQLVLEAAREDQVIRIQKQKPFTV